MKERGMMKQNRIRPKRFNDTKEKGSGYGVNCQGTDMAAEDFANEKEIILQKLKDYQQNCNANEEKTRMKERSALYQKITHGIKLRIGLQSKGYVEPGQKCMQEDDFVQQGRKTQQ